jgi:hypothetical protein
MKNGAIRSLAIEPITPRCCSPNCRRDIAKARDLLSSGVIKPKPFSSLNHLTVQVAIVFPPASLRAANAEVTQKQRLRPLALQASGKLPNLIERPSPGRQ